MNFAKVGENALSVICGALSARRFVSPAFRRFAAPALAAVIAACSGGGSPAGSVSKDHVPPGFKGVVLSYSSGKGALSLHWPVAADNVTSAANIVYNVYVGGSPDPAVIAQKSNLKMTVAGKTAASVYGLAPGGTYYCLVKAVDEAGNQSLNTGVSAVKVQAADLVAATAPKVLESMNVSVTQSGANTALISGADAATVRANDVLVLDNPHGQSLKKVIVAEPSGGSIAVVLQDTSLGEVVRSGVISSAASLASLANLPAQKTNAKTAGTSDLRYKDPAGFFEIAEYGTAEDSRAKAAKNMAKYDAMTALTPDVTLGHSIAFEPELATSATFDAGMSPNSLGGIRVSAKGTLSFSGMALYELKAAASHDVTRRVLNRGITLKYAIGAVPVMQDAYLEVMAHLKLNSDAPLNMYAELSASKVFEMTFEWNRATGWKQITSDSFDQRIALNVVSGGRVVGSLEIYPIISTRFYKAAKGGSYIVPPLRQDADAHIVPPPLEMAAFDAGFPPDSHIAANSRVFGFTIAEWEKERDSIYNQKPYSQPDTRLVAAPVAGTVGTDISASPPVADVKKPAAENTLKLEVLSFTDLTPVSVSTGVAPYKLTLTALGTNLGNVNKVTFTLTRVKTGAKGGTYVWIKGDIKRKRPWKSKVIMNPDGSMTLKPIITTPGDPARQTVWTVTLTDRTGATASKTFTVDYTAATGTPTVVSGAPPKAAPPVEKAKPVAPPPAPVAPPKVVPPVEKAKPVAPPPAPVAPPKAAPPVEKAKPVEPPPAPVAPPKAAPPVEKAKPVEPPSVPAAAAPKNLMGGAIQQQLTLGGTVSTVTGSAGVTGSADGAAATARFNYIHGITTDLTNLYVTDQNSGTIRKVVIATGAVTTLAGSAGKAGAADGRGAAAQFNLPEGITTDGTNLYVADKYNNTIRKIVIATGAVTTLAGSPGASGATDGTGPAARFTGPTGVTTDGTNLYVADKNNHTIRKIVIATGAVTTLAGSPGASGATDGTGAAARFTGPTGITTDGKNLYVADQFNYTIRKVVIATGAVTTLAGSPGISGAVDGKGAAARFTGPTGITTDGTNVYVTEYLNHTVRKVVIATGAVTTLAGSAGTAAQFNMPKGITTDGASLYVADYANHTIRKIK